jgi:hypothetical protein
LFLAKHCPGGNPEDERVTYLSGRAGNGDFDGHVHNLISHGSTRMKRGFFKLLSPPILLNPCLIRINLPLEFFRFSPAALESLSSFAEDCG